MEENRNRRINRENNKKMLIISLAIIVVTIIVSVIFAIIPKNSSASENAGALEKEQEVIVYEEPKVIEEKKEESKEEAEEKKDEKVDIVDVNSNSRPYMLVVNNTPVAVQVQEGLNRAYIVYEVPTEGNTSRLLALYRDIKDDLIVGTIRSARHNFIDYALESDAVFCCFGWSIFAEKDLRSGIIDYNQGLYGYPYYRENPEGLALEHTAYTSFWKIADDTINNKGYRTTTDNGLLLNYSTEDVDLTKCPENMIANNIVIPYGAAPNVTSFVYDENTKMYTRYESYEKCTDHRTGEDVTTKNIIVQKISYNVAEGNYYWDLHTTGRGEAYYITGGRAVPITWVKENRYSKTKFYYQAGAIVDGKDVGGKEITVSDGRTYIEVQTVNQNLTIE